MNDAVFRNFADRQPGKAAAASVRLLVSLDERDRQRGAALATALRAAARCAVCGRELRAPGSVEAGIGPECRSKTREARRALEVLRDAGYDVLDPAELEAAR